MTLKFTERIVFQVFQFGRGYVASVKAPSGGAGEIAPRRINESDSMIDAIAMVWEEGYEDLIAYLSATDGIERLRGCPRSVKNERAALRDLVENGIGRQLQALPPYNPGCTYEFRGGRFMRGSEYPTCGTVPLVDDVGNPVQDPLHQLRLELKAAQQVGA